MNNKLVLSKVSYDQLNPKQQENYNFQKVSSILADYGFVTLRLSDDWQGADFIAVHIDGKTFLKVQLKGRLAFKKEYLGKKIYICFPHKTDWYLFPHDDLQRELDKQTNYFKTDAWLKNGEYHMDKPRKEVLLILGKYKL